MRQTDGRGASELVDAEKAIIATLRPLRDDEPFTPGTAVALSRHAEVLHRYGDPDLAVAAADLAIRTFLNRRDEIGRSPQLYHPAFVKAGLVAEAVHTRFGRLDVAHSARKFAVRGVPGAESITVTPPVEPLGGMTLAGALDRMPGPLTARVKSSLTAPPLDCSLVHTSQRCTAEDAAAVAGILATGAAAVMAQDWAAGVRLALEAHVLYAVQSEQQSTEMRYNMAQHGPRWARSLLLSSQACAGHELTGLALDLASWMGGVVNALVPFAFADPATGSLVRECLTWHVELLRRSGDSEAAGNAAEALRGIDNLLP